MKFKGEVIMDENLIQCATLMLHQTEQLNDNYKPSEVDMKASGVWEVNKNDKLYVFLLSSGPYQLLAIYEYDHNSMRRVTDDLFQSVTANNETPEQWLMRAMAEAYEGACGKEDRLYQRMPPRKV